MLQPLLEARRLGLAVPATLLVKAYLDANGVTPKGVIARVLDVSVRTVERSLAELKDLGLSFENRTTGMTHDHANISKESNSDATTVSPEAADASVDPLEARLAAFGVLPWCVAIVMRDVSRDAVERQLAYHAFRLANGFVERTPGGAAKMLFRACLADFGPPRGYFEQGQRAAEAVAPAPVAAPAPRPAAAPATAVATPAAFEAAPAAEMTLDGAISAVRIGLKSKIPALRAHALELAARFGIDTHALAG